MKALVIPDSFKGGLPAKKFTEIAETAAKKYGFEAEGFPMIDGGEGTVETLTEIFGGEILTARLCDANFFKKSAKYGICDDCGVTAISETAHLPETLIKNPLYTTSYGLGESIKLIKKFRKKKIFIGLGGSATNDAGAGAVSALGGVFRDAEGSEFIPAGGNLEQIVSVNLDKFRETIADTEFIALSDVENPLLGDRGCSKVFAGQKGASPKDIEILERNMERFYKITSFSGTDADERYNGAAGGLGYGIRAFFGGKIYSGAEYYLKLINFAERLKSADLVITGEGRFDKTSAMGKACGMIGREAKKAGVPCVVFCGEKDAAPLPDGITAVYSVDSPLLTREENKKAGGENLRRAADEFFKTPPFFVTARNRG